MNSPASLLPFVKIVIGSLSVPALHDGSCVVSDPTGVYPNRNECPNLPSINISPINGCNEPTSVLSVNPTPNLASSSPPEVLGLPADVSPTLPPADGVFSNIEPLGNALL